MNDEDAVVEIGEDAELAAILGHLQRAVLEHPVAAQAMFSSLVAEGRAFARTEEGAAWRRRLAGSRLIEKGRVIWEMVTLNILEDDKSTVVPSRVLDAFVKLTHERAIETILSRLYDGASAGNSDASEV